MFADQVHTAATRQGCSTHDRVHTMLRNFALRVISVYGLDEEKAELLRKRIEATKDIPEVFDILLENCDDERGAA